MFAHSTSLIIPTKDRYNYLIRFFKSLDKYVKEFNEIIIIDSSKESEFKKIKNKFNNFNNIRIIKSKPSISIQRNIGIKNFNKKNKFIMFCDDDILFKKNTMENMNKFIIKNPKIIGYGFNLIRKEKHGLIEKLKRSKIFKNFGLYHYNSGKVCQNGWHTKLENIKKDTYVEWLSTQACIYKSKLLKNKSLFDTSLGNYSYLEDLFLSFELSKAGKLKVCHTSKYLHPNDIDRNNFKFGIQEIKNRYKFVKNNNLNVYKFYLTTLIKLLYTFSLILSLRLNKIPKFLGNCYEVILCLTRLQK